MILSCGEALIDMLPRESVAGEPSFAPYPGGAVFNTAIALGRLGVPSGFFSGVSTDLFGRMLETALAASHVDPSHALRSARPTTLAFVTLEAGQAQYAFYDEATAGRMVTPGDVPDVPEEVTALFFGGISLVAEPCGSAYEAMMLGTSATRVTMIDPNIRPSFITDETAYRARIERMVASADIVKVSDEDLHWLCGEGALADLAAALLAKGPKLVCVTEGAEGAHGFTTRDHVFVTAEQVAVADTVGAGDTFNAGVLAALFQAKALTKEAIQSLDAATLRAALSLGNRAAAVVVGRAGANPPWAREL